MSSKSGIAPESMHRRTDWTSLILSNRLNSDYINNLKSAIANHYRDCRPDPRCFTEIDAEIQRLSSVLFCGYIRMMESSLNDSFPMELINIMSQYFVGGQRQDKLAVIECGYIPLVVLKYLDTPRPTWTHFKYAWNLGQHLTVSLMLKLGVENYIPNTSLIELYRNGNGAVISALLSHWKSSKYTIWKLGHFLYWARNENKVDLVRQLVIDHVVDINMEIPEWRTSQNKLTPLWIASQSHHGEMLEMMITEGSAIDFNVQMKSGTFNDRPNHPGAGRVAALRVICVAVKFGYVDVLQGIYECLMAKWSKERVDNLMNARAINNCWTALHVACLRGHTNVVQYLLKTVQVNIHITDRYGRTALDLATEINCVEIIELFTEHQNVSRLSTNEVVPLSRKAMSES